MKIATPPSRGLLSYLPSLFAMSLGIAGFGLHGQAYALAVAGADGTAAAAGAAGAAAGAATASPIDATIAIDAGAPPALSSVLHTNRAAAHYMLGEYADAAGDCVRAVALEPDNTKAMLRGAADRGLTGVAFTGSVSLVDDLSVSGAFTVLSDRIIRNDNLPWQNLGFAIGQTVAFTTGGVTKLYTITDFDIKPASAGGDVLDLRDLLVGEHSGGTANLTQYLSFGTDGGKLALLVDHDGTTGGAGVDQKIVLDKIEGALVSLGGRLGGCGGHGGLLEG
mgnify:CR=1 FL=1